MKKKILFCGVLIAILIVGIGILITRIDEGDEVVNYNMDAHPGLEWERVNNSGYNKFDFLWFPAEVEGTQETAEKINQLIEAGEEYIVSHPEEIVAIRLDNDEEVYTFLEELQEELKYTDKAIGENMFYKMLLMMNVRVPQPQFLLYIPVGNLTHEYYVTEVGKKGKGELYITIKRVQQSNNEDTMDGCLIGVIPQSSDDKTTIKEASTMYIDIIE